MCKLFLIHKEILNIFFYKLLVFVMQTGLNEFFS